MTKSLLERVEEPTHCFDLTTISNTASFLLAQVQGNLDHTLLDSNKLEAKLAECSLLADVVQPMLDIF